MRAAGSGIEVKKVQLDDHCLLRRMTVTRVKLRSEDVNLFATRSEYFIFPFTHIEGNDQEASIHFVLWPNAEEAWGSEDADGREGQRDRQLWTAAWYGRLAPRL